MAGGNWISQNKVLPGVYINFRTAGGIGLTVGDRGTVTICEPMNWGAVNTVQTVTQGMDYKPITGYSSIDANNQFLTEIFKGTNRTPAPKQVLLYRPSGTGGATATATIGNLTVVALYRGTRGNDITVAITADVDNDGIFTVSTIVDGEVVDEQTASTVDTLVNNEWVTFEGTGVLAANAGTTLTGGTNGTISANDFASYLIAIEPYKFDVMIYDGTDETVKTALQAFIKRVNEENGSNCQLVAANLTAPDSRYTINVTSGATLSDGTSLTANQVTWWVGGATAGAMYNQSLTYAAYPNAVTVTPVLTNAQQAQALSNGEFVLFADNGVVKVLQDINSLTTFTTDIGKVYSKNRAIRLVSTIANDIYAQFSANFIGVVNNNANGRSLFKAAIVGYLLDIQANEGIQNFEAEDVEVLAGTDSDAVVVNLAIQFVDAAEKIYITLTLA